jgi:DtxR family transcriptional regulator, Mn-dependent transcriptional regulator
MNISIEDYLRIIYFLYEKQIDKSVGIKAVDVANELDVTKPSVTGMVKKIIKLGYLKAKPYSRIHLTKKGLKEAKRIMHNHRLIEVFLVNALGCKLDEIHDEAHRLEHAFSDEIITKLDNFLQNPEISPLGKKIPHK